MQLGVQTHFSQGWNTSWLAKVQALGVDTIRDSQPWTTVEKTPGVFTYTPTLVNYMDKAEALGIDALLTFASANTLYDSGLTPYTETGRKAYAAYIVNVLQKYGVQVEKIEIWNEFNAGSFKGPAASEPDGAYTALLKTVYETVKPLFPDVQILGGSTNVIGTGALEGIFKLGALNYMDGVVVHPYRNVAEHVDAELVNLNAVMEKYGDVKPIYATEFGNQFTDPKDVPDFMVKMVTLMSSVHVKEAYWYALLDQSFYKNMGLYTSTGEAKPAAAAFSFIEKSLLPLGDAIQVATGDADTLVYRFGSDTYVMWGSDRAVSFAAGGTFYNAKGEVIEAPTSLSMAPVVFKGSSFILGDDKVVADSLLGFGEGQFQYFAQTKNGTLTPLTNVDWDWTSYLGSQYTKPLRVNADSIAPAGDGANPIRVVERYVSDRDQKLSIDADWTTSGSGDGVDIHILVNGVEIFSRIVNGTLELNNFIVSVAKGDKVDFVVGPNQYVTGDSTTRRLILTRVDEVVKPEAPVAAKPVVENKILNGTSAADTLTGAAGNDVLYGFAGHDVLRGSAGDDILDGGAGKNVLDGGDGFDTASYASASAAVKVALGTEAFQKINANITDRLLNIEAVIGSDYADTLVGSAADESFFGGSGNDIFWASEGHDRIDGGEGVDTANFTRWTDDLTLSLATSGAQVTGAMDDVRLSGIEILLSGSGEDRLTASALGSTIDGGAGDDIILSGTGNDTLMGGAGIDMVSYESALAGVAVSLANSAAQNTGGAGVDIIRQFEGIVGSAFADTLTGSKLDDILKGEAGNDILDGGRGVDTLYGGAGADKFLFSSAVDSSNAYDVIADFSQREGDFIDLSLIDANGAAKGAGAFVLVDSFSKIAGQLLIIKQAGGYLVTGDTNGDGIADFGIHVHTSGPLGAADFIM